MKTILIDRENSGSKCKDADAVINSLTEILSLEWVVKK